MGAQALREVFDRMQPPKGLHSHLSSDHVHETLQFLRKGKSPKLNPTQWEKLYPRSPSALSSANFDITLLVVLLRKTCGLSRLHSDSDRFPQAVDKSTEADIKRLEYFRNKVHSHWSESSLTDDTFNTYWLDISDVLLRLGGAKCEAAIERIKHERIDADIGDHYQQLLNQWVEDSKIAGAHFVLPLQHIFIYLVGEHWANLCNGIYFEKVNFSEIMFFHLFIPLMHYFNMMQMSNSYLMVTSSAHSWLDS